MSLWLTPGYLRVLHVLITASIWGTVSPMASPKLSLQISIWISAQPCQPGRERILKYIFPSNIGTLPLCSLSCKVACEREGKGPLVHLLSLFTNLILGPDSVVSKKVVVEDSYKKKRALGCALCPHRVKRGTRRERSAHSACHEAGRSTHLGV